LVDFNHPLAGKELVYDIKVNKIITDDKEKLQSILKINLGLKDSEIKVENKKAEIKTEQELPQEIQVELKKKIIELLPHLEDITMGKSEKKPKEDKAKQENLNKSNATEE
jgi:hypothetical protein